MNKYKVNKCFRFDEKTDNILKHLVEKENETSNKKISESEFMRELIQRCGHEHMGVPKNMLTQMSRNMAGCGNNINQIAHRINMDIYTYEDVWLLRECMKDISEVKELLRKLISEMY